MKREDRTWARRLHRSFHPTGDFTAWLAQVQEVRVTMFPGARAVLVHPEIGWLVTIYWGETVREVKTIRMDGDRHLEPKEQLPLSVYVAALGLQLPGKSTHLAGGTAQITVEPSQPKPGRGPVALGHYVKVNARYDELVREGEKAPIRVIAEEYGVQEGTVKMWRWRSRKYLKGDTR